MDKNPKVKWKLVRNMLYKAFNEILAVSAEEEVVWGYLRVFGSSGSLLRPIPLLFCETPILLRKFNEVDRDQEKWAQR